jgi:hypothetical protein
MFRKSNTTNAIWYRTTKITMIALSIGMAIGSIGSLPALVLSFDYEKLIVILIFGLSSLLFWWFSRICAKAESSLRLHRDIDDL